MRVPLRHMAAMSLPDPSTYIAEGASAEVFSLGGGHVLKLFHAGIDAGIVDREYAIAQAVHATGLPVAEVIERREQAGRLGIVYAEMEGPNLLQYIGRHPWRTSWALREMARLQRRISDQRMPALRGRKQILADDIEVAPIGSRLRLAALDRLEQLREGDRLSHGDLHPGNLIMTPGGLAVIDWSRAARAEPATDMVRTEMLMRFGPGRSGGLVEDTTRDAVAACYMRQCRRHAGARPEALVAWRALVALAWMRQRQPVREAAFRRYLADALAAAGLPPLDDMSFVD